MECGSEPAAHCSTPSRPADCRMTFTARDATFPPDRAYHHIPRARYHHTPSTRMGCAGNINLIPCSKQSECFCIWNLSNGLTTKCTAARDQLHSKLDIPNSAGRRALVSGDLGHMRKPRNGASFVVN